MKGKGSGEWRDRAARSDARTLAFVCPSQRRKMEDRVQSNPELHQHYLPLGPYKWNLPQAGYNYRGGGVAGVKTIAEGEAVSL